MANSSALVINTAIREFVELVNNGYAVYSWPGSDETFNALYQLPVKNGEDNSDIELGERVGFIGTDTTCAELGCKALARYDSFYCLGHLNF